jgi:hypothetical protein
MAAMDVRAMCTYTYCGRIPECNSIFIPSAVLSLHEHMQVLEFEFCFLFQVLFTTYCESLKVAVRGPDFMAHLYTQAKSSLVHTVTLKMKANKSK